MKTVLNKIYNLKKYIGWYLGLKDPKFSNKKYGFLHIGKKSGTSLLNFFKILDSEKNIQVPMWFSHEWRLRDIIKFYPKIKISIILRDPLERIISGFYSLQIRNGKVWRPNEAVCHSFFTNVDDYLRAITQDQNIFEKNKAEYLTVTNRHINRGYEFYFESIDFIQKNISKFYYVGNIDQMKDSTNNILQKPNNFEDLFQNNYKHLRKFDYPNINIDVNLKEKVQKYFKKEYEIYNFFLKNLKRINK